MNIFIRTDASSEIGTGHVMRCLTLAEYLRERGSTVSFIVQKLPGDMCQYIEQKHFLVYRINENNHYLLPYNWKMDASETKNILTNQHSVDWLIVDHYLLDKDWEKMICPFVNAIMVIDDLANRHHECDVLLDQNYYKYPELRYQSLVPDDCLQLLGPNYVLLRKQFLETRKHLKPHTGKVKRLLIFFGGSDPTNETTKAILAIQALNLSNIHVDVVVGNTNRYKNEIKTLCHQSSQFLFHCQIENIAELMTNADLAIGSGGTTTWERCYLGLPSITIAIAKNQLKITGELASAGVIRHLGWHSNVSIKSLAKAIKETIEADEQLKLMSNRAINVIPHLQMNLPVHHIIKHSVLEYVDYKLRPIKKEELELILKWRNSDRIRKNMYEDSIISMKQHKKWFQSLKSSKSVYLVFEHRTKPLGVVYFHDIDEKNNKCTWGFYIGEESPGKGTGTILGYLGLEYAFTKLKIRKVSGETFAFNEASIHFHKKLMFKEEGKLNHHVLRNGSFEDIFLFSLFSEEWEKNKEMLKKALKV